MNPVRLILNVLAENLGTRLLLRAVDFLELKRRVEELLLPAIV